MTDDEKLDAILDILRAPPGVATAELRVEVEDLERRVTELESRRVKRAEWFRGVAPIVLIMAVGLAVNLYLAFH